MANRINIFKKIKQDLEEVSERKKYLKYFKSCLTEQSLNEFNIMSERIMNDSADYIGLLARCGWYQSSDRKYIYSKKTGAYLIYTENGYQIDLENEQSEDLINIEQYYLNSDLVFKTICDGLTKVNNEIELFHNRDWQVTADIALSPDNYKKFINVAHVLGYMQTISWEDKKNISIKKSHNNEISEYEDLISILNEDEEVIKPRL